MADGHLKWRRPPGIARECITDARKRILRAADHLGYRVNRLAQSLINARSNVIGLVGTDLQQPFHAELLTTLSAALLAEGLQCMLLNAGNAKRDTSALIARVQLCSGRPAGGGASARTSVWLQRDLHRRQQAEAFAEKIPACAA
jgi:hypothetical protein